MANAKSHESKIIDVEGCLGRIKRISGEKTDSGLVSVLGLTSGGAIGNWRKRGGIPVQVIFDFCVRYRADFNYVCFGDGETPWSGWNSDQNSKVLAKIDPISDLLSDVESWLRSQDDAPGVARDLKGALGLIIPSFGEWQKKLAEHGEVDTLPGSKSSANGK